MKRLILISGWPAFLLLALFVGGHALAQNGHTGAYLRVWSDDGTMQDYQCQAVSMDETATPEVGETPIPTALPATATPTKTPNPTPSPAPTSTPLPACWGTVTADKLNIRTGPGVEFAIYQIDGANQTYLKGDRIGLLAKTTNSQGDWYQVSAKPVLWVSATWVQLGSGAQCSFATAMRTAPASRLGLHLTVGASQDTVFAALPRLGSLKGTTGTENILIGARQRRPDLLEVYRVTSPDCPAGWGSGDARALADSWWNAKYSQWQHSGMIGVVDYFELTNECGTPASAWETAFWLRSLENADLAGVCLSLFSDSYGTPEILQFQFRAPVLDYILAHPCKSGLYHSMALHSYEGVGSGDWKWGRWRLFMAALGSKYREIPILFTEYAYNTGNPPVDCGALWTDWAQAAKVFEADSQVWAAEYFNVSGVGQWADISPCLK